MLEQFINDVNMVYWTWKKHQRPTERLNKHGDIPSPILFDDKVRCRFVSWQLVFKKLSKEKLFTIIIFLEQNVKEMKIKMYLFFNLTEKVSHIMLLNYKQYITINNNLN